MRHLRQVGRFLPLLPLNFSILTTTRRAWQAIISVPPPVGYAYVICSRIMFAAVFMTSHFIFLRNSHPPEPQCSYDPVEGLPIAPDVDPAERIRALEEQICGSFYCALLVLKVFVDRACEAQLKSQLHESRTYNSRSASPSRHFTSGHRPGTSVSTGRSPDSSPHDNGISLPHASLDLGSGAAANSPRSVYRGSTGSPDVLHGSNGDQYMDMLFSGWDPDLPDPATLEH